MIQSIDALQERDRVQATDDIIRICHPLGDDVNSIRADANDAVRTSSRATR